MFHKYTVYLCLNSVYLYFSILPVYFSILSVCWFPITMYKKITLFWKCFKFYKINNLIILTLLLLFVYIPIVYFSDNCLKSYSWSSLLDTISFICCMNLIKKKWITHYYYENPRVFFMNLNYLHWELRLQKFQFYDYKFFDTLDVVTMTKW